VDHSVGSSPKFIEDLESLMGERIEEEGGGRGQNDDALSELHVT
jgi:hypothetical protein